MIEPSPGDRARALASIRRIALTAPDHLPADTLRALAEGLASSTGAPDICAATLGAVSAVLYARPEDAEPALFRPVAAVLRAPGAPAPIVAAAVRLLEFFATTPGGDQAWHAVLEALRSGPLIPAAAGHVVPLLRTYAHWQLGAMELDDLLALLSRPDFAPHRDAALGLVVERFVYAAPDRFTPAHIERMLGIFDGCPRLRYTLAALGERRPTRASVRVLAAGRIATAFEHRAAARALLAAGPFRVLAVMNVKIGQGDEVIRFAPLLQALLDANAELTAAVVTKRTYLYDHPRVRTVPIGDDTAVSMALGERFDGLIHVAEPNAADVAERPDLDTRVRAWVVRHDPRVVIAGDVGRGYFLYGRVKLGDRELAGPLGLDRLAFDNAYDACSRLLLELGLPSRAAREEPRGPSVLVGTPSADAECAWTMLVQGGEAQRAGRRPVALVNAFGGATSAKGYRFDGGPALGPELAGLVREGYRVIVLPNGTPWGDRAAITRALYALSAEERGHVAAPPDPADPGAAADWLTERPELSHDDRVMRLFKYFAAYADLVVAVEGWMAHLAYNLGRPFRLALMAESQHFRWQPHGRGSEQRLVSALSPLTARPAAGDLLGDLDAPPLPPQRRKALLETALWSVGGPADPDTIRLLRRVWQSEDFELRAAAAAALGRLRPLSDVTSDLLTALRDRDAGVRRAAAEALLDGQVDLTRELGRHYRDQLEAHRAIAAQAWKEVHRRGLAVVPALIAAAEGEPIWIRREARTALIRVLRGAGIGAARS